MNQSDRNRMVVLHEAVCALQMANPVDKASTVTVESLSRFAHACSEIHRELRWAIMGVARPDIEDPAEQLNILVDSVRENLGKVISEI